MRGLKFRRPPHRLHLSPADIRSVVVRQSIGVSTQVAGRDPIRHSAVSIDVEAVPEEADRCIRERRHRALQLFVRAWYVDVADARAVTQREKAEWPVFRCPGRRGYR